MALDAMERITELRLGEGGILMAARTRLEAPAAPVSHVDPPPHTSMSAASQHALGQL